ncbi:resolvase [Enterococcus sp. C1]|nr:recombinase family protein [Enterococcus sp. C1]EJF47961.1 resolvase [Enterococcus sp. C1]
MTKYGYARVSTASQSTKEQIQQLLDNGVEKKNIFSERFTGTKRDRPKFNRLLDGLKYGDEIIVTKLDRFARNTREALENIEPLLNDNVTIKVLNLGMIENTSMGRMIVRTMLVIVQFKCNTKKSHKLTSCIMVFDEQSLGGI